MNASVAVAILRDCDIFLIPAPLPRLHCSLPNISTGFDLVKMLLCASRMWAIYCGCFLQRQVLSQVYVRWFWVTLCPHVQNNTKDRRYHQIALSPPKSVLAGNPCEWSILWSQALCSLDENLFLQKGVIWVSAPYQLCEGTPPPGSSRTPSSPPFTPACRDPPDLLHDWASSLLPALPSERPGVLKSCICYSLLSSISPTKVYGCDGKS